MKWTPIEPDFREMVKEKIEGNHFTNHLGIEIHRIDAGYIEASVAISDPLRQQMGFVHGGVSATLADVVMGFAAFTLVKRGNGVVTVDLKVSYLNPGAGDKLYAKGWIIKAGQRLMFCEAEIYLLQGDQQVPVAKASSIMSMVTPEDLKRVSA